MSPKPVKTYEQYLEEYYSKYLRLKQFRSQLDADPPTITLEDLRNKARGMALSAVNNDTIIANREIIDIDADLESDADYRNERMDEYLSAGDWDDVGDKALLISLVELETQHRAIRRDLARATTGTVKDRLWDSLRENSTSQKDLQIVLGIDKKSREATRAAGSPIDNWREIKDEVGDWVDMLVQEFVAEAAETENESALRDLIKYKLSWPLAVVDSVVYNLKRLNGMETDGEG